VQAVDVALADGDQKLKFSGELNPYEQCLLAAEFFFREPRRLARLPHTRAKHGARRH
jgi:hypothetical protein